MNNNKKKILKIYNSFLKKKKKTEQTCNEIVPQINIKYILKLQLGYNFRLEGIRKVQHSKADNGG